METALKALFDPLEPYKYKEDDREIIYRFPKRVQFDFTESKGELLKIFEDVVVEFDIVHGRFNTTEIRCIKKREPTKLTFESAFPIEF